MNPVERVLHQELTGLLDRLATSVSEGGFENIRATRVQGEHPGGSAPPPRSTRHARGRSVRLRRARQHKRCASLSKRSKQGLSKRRLEIVAERVRD